MLKNILDTNNEFFDTLNRYALNIEQVVVHNKCTDTNYFTSIIGNYRTYSVKDDNTFVNSIKQIVFDKIDSLKEMEYVKDRKRHVEFLKWVLNFEKPDLVVFFCYSPDIEYSNICKENQFNQIWMLYDTFISRPNLNVENAYRIENAVITNSAAYFVPSFFSEDYNRLYQSRKVIYYELPLLISQDEVNSAYKRNNDSIYQFTYFGQIQKFRNRELIIDICNRAGISIDVFTDQRFKSDDALSIHRTISGVQLYDTIVQSRVLVAFDNSYPFNHYLPSKAILYASFGKPVLAFGDNSESALLSFFAKYPQFYYHNINSSSLNELSNFISDLEEVHCFQPAIYNTFLNFLPQNALVSLQNTIVAVCYS